jgi:alpha-L-rhamnosidase
MFKYFPGWLFIGLMWSCATKPDDDLSFQKLRCEYAENPINIDTGTPRFSWVVEDSGRGRSQTAYQVLVASSPGLLSSDKADLWNSGKVRSDATLHISYAGAALRSNTRYFWNVRIWDEQNRAFSSNVASFETALLSSDDWSADWIGANAAIEPAPVKGFFMHKSEEATIADTVHHDGRSVLLRREFDLEKSILSAKLFITGLGFYEAELNGQRIGDAVLAPAKTPYHKEILYDTYDVTAFLQNGENAIGIHLGNGWYDPYKKWWQEYRMQWFGYKKAIAQLHIRFEDGTEEKVVTDGNWKTDPGPVLYNCVYDGEIYDANEEISDWSKPGFDDSAWKPAVVMRPPSGKLVSETMPPIKINEVRQPVQITEPKPNMKVYDLGQNFTGWVRLKMSGSKGDKIRIRFSEELYEDGTLNFTCNENAKATVDYTLKGDRIEYYEPRFTYFGFQYVEITAEEKLPEIHVLEGCVIYSANNKIGDFSSSNELINKMHHATVWSQMSNMQGYPMDCPQRDERLGWMGDAQVTAEEAMFNFDMAQFYRNWFRGIRSNQNHENGDIPIISPRPYIRDDGVEWSSSYPTMVWNYYMYYADTLVLEENYDAMVRYMDFLASISKKRVLPKGWIGDWGSMVVGWQEGEPKSVPTAYYFYDATILKKIAHILNRQSDEATFTELASEIKRAYSDNFFNPQTNDYNDGSQMANAFPLFLGLVPEDKVALVLANLIHDIEVENGTHLTTGVLGTKYLMETLSMMNRSDVAWALATQTTYPSWAEMMKRFNTMCEFWTLKQSHNHVMMGSIDAWFYKTLAGIQIQESDPAYKTIVIKPFLADGLTRSSGYTYTLRGTVGCDWELNDTGFRMNVKVPFNCKAIVYVPSAEDIQILEGGTAAVGNKSITSLGCKNGYYLFEAGSGTYSFNY